MLRQTLIRVLFIVAALYDGILGAVFLLAGPSVFSWFDVTPPNHWGYIQFPAALLLVFSLMFASVAARPQANRNLIVYGMLLKLSFSGMVFFHWAMNNVPWMWKPLGVIDAGFLAGFGWAYWMLTRSTPTAKASAST